MANSKISQLPNGNLTPSTIFPIVTNGITSKTTFENMVGKSPAYIFRVGGDSGNHYHLAYMSVEEAKSLVEGVVNEVLLISDEEEGHTHTLTVQYDDFRNIFIVVNITSGGSIIHEAYLLGLQNIATYFLQEPVRNFIDFTINEPTLPNFGEAYISTTSGVGSNSGKNYNIDFIYRWNGHTFLEMELAIGLSVYVIDLDDIFKYTNTGWGPSSSSPITLVGSNSLFSTALNAGSGASNSTSSNFIGQNAGFNATNSSNSNFFGNQAGNNATDSPNSNFFGYYTGFGALNSNNSNFIGQNTGFQASGVSYSNFIGQSAGYLATDSSYSNLFGYNVGRVFSGNNIGPNNIIIGTNISLPNGATNSMNLGGVLFGFNTYSATTGNPSITNTPNGRIGINKATDNGVDTLQIGGTLNIGSVPAGTSINNLGIDATGKVVIGSTGGGTGSTSPITLVGSNSLFSTVLKAGSGATNAIYSNFIGQNTGSGATNAYYSNFIGYDAGFNATGSFESNFLGFEAGYKASNATKSNFIGSSAGSGASNVTSSNFIGSSAGQNASGSSSSNFFGNGAGNGATNANESNFIGLSSGQNAKGSNQSNFLGKNSGLQASGSSRSNFIGNNAGSVATAANESNFIGFQAGSGAKNSTSSNFLGYEAGFGAIDVLNSNFFGRGAGFQASGASTSTFIGFNTGKFFAGNNVGSNNIVIGTNISLPNGATNSMNLGGVLFGFNTYSATTGNPSITNALNGRIGINKSIDNGVDTLQIGGTLNIGSVPVFDDNTAASGLTVGSVYRTSTGVLMIRF